MRDNIVIIYLQFYLFIIIIYYYLFIIIYYYLFIYLIITYLFIYLFIFKCVYQVSTPVVASGLLSWAEPLSSLSTLSGTPTTTTTLPSLTSHPSEVGLPPPSSSTLVTCPSALPASTRTIIKYQ